MNSVLRLLALPAVLALFTGCGTAYRASAGSQFAVDNGKEIDDSDVAKAFAASPQIGERVKVAYYTFDDARADDIEKTIARTPNVASVYRIPPLLVTGKRRFHETSPWAPPQEVGTKKLRLLAARAHADVLVVFDHGWRGGGANGWAALNVLVVPIFVTPWLSNETESYAQAYVIDVRNGYLYGEVSAEQKSGGARTIYGPDVDDVANEQWPKLLASLEGELAKKLAPTAPRATSGEPAASRE
jgi:hypothetical protein